MPASAARTARCAVSGSTTVMANQLVRIYSRPVRRNVAGCTEGAFETIVTTDLATRRQRKVRRPAGRPQDVELDSIEVADLEVRSTGALAYILCATGSAGASLEVGLLPTGERTARALDSGTAGEIEAGSLGLSATRVYWTKERHAVFIPDPVAG